MRIYGSKNEFMKMAEAFFFILGYGDFCYY